MLNDRIWAVFALLIALLHAPSAGATQPDPTLQLSDFQLSELKNRYGSAAIARINTWQKLVQRLQRANDTQKLQGVNRFFNNVRSVTDDEHWQQEDYWATPIELLASNGGDCEDFAIAKYFTLTKLGLPAHKMRLTYVKALAFDQEHMVLSYYNNSLSEPLVLDNLTNHIKPASQRPDLVPVFSFNAQGVWQKKFQGDTVAGDADRIVSWKRLRQRLMLRFNP